MGSTAPIWLISGKVTVHPEEFPGTNVGDTATLP